MQKKLLHKLRDATAAVTAAFLLSALSGCGLFSGKINDPNDPQNWPASKLYAEARNEMSSGSYEKAIQLFEKLEARYPFGTFAQQAQMEIAYAYYRQADQAMALAAVDRFIKLHPNHQNVDYMYYLRGLVNFNDKLSVFDFISRQDPTERDPKGARDAFEAFKQLVERFPKSKYTPDAVARMKYLINAMAQHEVHVAKYYFGRGAFVAAVNRAQTVVKDYREAPAVEEALFLMMRSYDALNLPELRNDTERVLKKNFPKSAFLNDRQGQSQPWWKIW